jgi:hypothetical protein
MVPFSMKKYGLWVVIATILSITFTACKENTKSAKQYHDTIYQSVDTIISNVFALDNHLQNDSIKAARASFDRLKVLIDANTKLVEEKGPYSGDDQFRKSSLELLKFYHDYTNNKFSTAINIASHDSLSEAEKNKITSIVDEFYDEESRYIDAFNKASYEFGDKYKIYKAAANK